MNFLKQQFLKWHENKEKLRELRWFDILILTLIFFGFSIYSSNIEFFSPPTDIGLVALDSESTLNYSEYDNYSALISQSVLLILGLLYLKIRNFDFSQWKIKFTPFAVVATFFLFVMAALLSDFCLFIADKIQTSDGEETIIYQGYNFFDTIKNTDLSLYIYSLLNGFYEEIYFLGICLSVNKKFVIPAFIFSLFVRFSFHTYQGISYAIAITSIGVLYFAVYMLTKKKNLLPFFLSHTIADIIGLSIIWYFIPQ